MSDKGNRRRANAIKSAEKKSGRMSGRRETLRAAFMGDTDNGPDDHDFETGQSASIFSTAQKAPRRDF